MNTTSPAELTLTAFMSLDGVTQAPGGPAEDTTGGFRHGGWVVPHFDEDMGAAINEIFAKAQRTPSYEERLRLAAEFQHIISREAPLIYTVNEAVNTAVYNRFGNFNPSVYSLLDVDMMYDRTLKPGGGD